MARLGALMAAVVAVVTAPTAAAQAMLCVSGASGVNADSVINGRWQMHEYFNGFPSWQKVGKTEVVLARVSSGKWKAGYTNGYPGFLCQADETPYDSPTQVPAWTVYSGSAWEEQTVRVEDDIQRVRRSIKDEVSRIQETQEEQSQPSGQDKSQPSGFWALVVVPILLLACGYCLQRLFCSGVRDDTNTAIASPGTPVVTTAGHDGAVVPNAV
eukprot:CAMPEP_0203947656 /NCGR_PEP_ID=MMETSP0359-20131031/82545_1 /ASSEMBLY_ACC=CAM_ASM_000338 /TAXON_ID=268821 /ORGANISM="Scrippsiella Hangoei, Strain SHTV-5" /LENGTH=212 /DNA_ID=CAMNT_0050879095 /DNA_START=32 /DNA_END=670 /DNA_ORIENTATION=+